MKHLFYSASFVRLFRQACKTVNGASQVLAEISALAACFMEVTPAAVRREMLLSLRTPEPDSPPETERACAAMADWLEAEEANFSMEKGAK